MYAKCEKGREGGEWKKGGGKRHYTISGDILKTHINRENLYMHHDNHSVVSEDAMNMKERMQRFLL